MTNAYIAGFFDGEGCVRIAENGNSFTPFASLTQKDHTVLLAIQKKIKMGTVKATKNGVCSLILVGRQAEKFLRKIRPYLIVKAKQVDITLALADRIQTGNRARLSSEEIEIRQRMAKKVSELKKFDNPQPFLYNVVQIS